MSHTRFLLMVSIFAGLLTGMTLPAMAEGGSHKLAGTRFEMEVPTGWNTGYKDPDNMFMIFYKDHKSGAVLEGVYLRGVQPATFTLADFKKARIDQQNKVYEGKGHKVAKEGDTTIAGSNGTYLLTTGRTAAKTWKNTPLNT
jgi:hypothetical protein